ncbi:MAG: acetylglutamate kinase [Tannerellaceae bacterium]|nr:acetylglutamate kinase [Tannerellaceae bacterium]
MKKLTVVKVGGRIVEEDKALSTLLTNFCLLDGYRVLVHGGGRSATDLAARLGIESRMVNGRRVTDEEMLKVVVMVYGGWINKRIVAGIESLGLDAIGLTGADINVMRSIRRPKGEVDYGFVGDIFEVRSDVLVHFLRENIIPVLAPITHDRQGNLLNTNADTIAGATAEVLSRDFEVTLIYCFEKPGVLMDESDETSVIPEITYRSFRQYVSEGIIQGGMIPKLENALEASERGVSKIIITNLKGILTGRGTRVSFVSCKSE